MHPDGREDTPSEAARRAGAILENALRSFTPDFPEYMAGDVAEALRALKAAEQLLNEPTSLQPPRAEALAVLQIAARVLDRGADVTDGDVSASIRGESEHVQALIREAEEGREIDFHWSIIENPAIAFVIQPGPDPLDLGQVVPGAPVVDSRENFVDNVGFARITAEEFNDGLTGGTALPVADMEIQLVSPETAVVAYSPWRKDNYVIPHADPALSAALAQLDHVPVFLTTDSISDEGLVDPERLNRDLLAGSVLGARAAVAAKATGKIDWQFE